MRIQTVDGVRIGQVYSFGQPHAGWRMVTVLFGSPREKAFFAIQEHKVHE